MSDYTSGSFGYVGVSFDLPFLITLVSDYPFGSFDYVGVCPSIYGF